MNLLESFAPSAEGEWKDKIIADLKGAPLESLHWESELGNIDPILFDYTNKYTRIPSKSKQIDNAWITAKTVDCTDAQKANVKILKDLSEGANGIRLVNIQNSPLKVILKDVMIDLIHLTIEGSTAAHVTKLTTEINEVATSDGLHLEDCTIFIVNDSIFSHILGVNKELNIHSGQVVVKGCLFANAGGSIQNQVAFTLAQGHEYLVSQLEIGIPFEKALNNISFRLAIGNSYFAEIAKLRAFRTLWHNVIEQYGDATSSYTTITVETSEFYQSNLDIHNNLLRGTTSAMASIIGGADIIEVYPYDMQLDAKTSDADRLATNTLLILQEESFFNQVKNASDGSYYIEQLTDIIIEKSWTKFQQVEEKGGFISYFQSKEMISDLNIDLKKKLARYENNELILLGTNKYPNSDESNSENFREYVFGGSVIRPYRLALKSI